MTASTSAPSQDICCRKAELLALSYCHTLRIQYWKTACSYANMPVGWLVHCACYECGGQNGI